MLDKIVLSSSRKQALLVFTNRDPITVSSDEDVVPLLLWLLGDNRAKLRISTWNQVTGIDLNRDTSGEVTMKIDMGRVA